MLKADKFYKEYLGQEWDIDIKFSRINCETVISKMSRCPISFILSVLPCYKFVDITPAILDPPLDQIVTTSYPLVRFLPLSADAAPYKCTSPP